MKLAIALFVYNQITHLENLLDEISQYSLAKNVDVYVYSDGPKDSERDRMAVAHVRSIVRSYESETFTLVTRDENAGLKASILGGVDTVLECFDGVIVLEDDLIISQQTLSFFEQALRFYENTDRVMSVTGYVPRLRRPTRFNDRTFFLQHTQSWGWATWRRAWRLFEQRENIRCELLESNSFRRTLKSAFPVNYERMIRLAERRSIDSWYIYWQVCHVLCNGLCVYPPQTLVLNGGLSQSGRSHASRYNAYWGFKRYADELLSSPPRMNDQIEIDFLMLDAFMSSEEILRTRLNHFLGSAKRRLRLKRR